MRIRVPEGSKEGSMGKTFAEKVLGAEDVIKTDEGEVRGHQVGQVPGAADGRRPPPDRAGGTSPPRTIRCRLAQTRATPSTTRRTGVWR